MTYDTVPEFFFSSLLLLLPMMLLLVGVYLFSISHQMPVCSHTSQNYIE